MSNLLVDTPKFEKEFHSTASMDKHSKFTPTHTSAQVEILITFWDMCVGGSLVVYLKTVYKCSGTKPVVKYGLIF